MNTDSYATTVVTVVIKVGVSMITDSYATTVVTSVILVRVSVIAPYLRAAVVTVVIMVCICTGSDNYGAAVGIANMVAVGVNVVVASVGKVGSTFVALTVVVFVRMSTLGLGFNGCFALVALAVLVRVYVAFAVFAEDVIDNIASTDRKREAQDKKNGKQELG